MITAPSHVVHPLAAGLDVHKMEITACARLCEAGQDTPRIEMGTFSALPDGLRQMTQWLQSHQVTAVAMEATGIYWEAPHDALERAGIKVGLHHAQHIKQLRGRKTDVSDSHWLSFVCQFGLGTPSLVLPPSFRELRNMSRHRTKMTHEMARTRNRVHKVLDRSGIRLGGILSDIFGMNGRRILQGLVDGQSPHDIVVSLSRHVAHKSGLLRDALDAPLTPSDRFILSDLLEAHHALQQRIDRCEAYIDEHLQPYEKDLSRLQTIPGISQISARTLLIEMGPGLSCFGNARRFAAWCGVCPGNHESAGKRRRVAVRHGNPHIRAALVECAHGAVRTKDCQYHGYFKTMIVRHGVKRAIVDTAHKLARTVFAVMRDRKPYHDPYADYELLLVKRNAARWIRQLKAHNILEETDINQYRRNYI